MRISARGRCVGVICAAALMGAGATLGAQADDGWEAALRLQLEIEKKCQLDHTISVRQRPVGEAGGIEGRVSCKDGREFDFSRAKAHQKFEFRLCAPAVC